jgi:hypothetical protein
VGIGPNSLLRWRTLGELQIATQGLTTIGKLAKLCESDNSAKLPRVWTQSETLMPPGPGVGHLNSLVGMTFAETLKYVYSASVWDAQQKA